MVKMVFYSYFTLPKEKLTVEKQDELMHTDWGKHCMAHNGWVMNDDPLRNFAESGISRLFFVVSNSVFI